MQTQMRLSVPCSVKTDYYLLKPWDPPEERLYPVVNDLLDDWLSSFRPPFTDSCGWFPLVANRIKSKTSWPNQVPYQWMDIEADEEARRLVSMLNLMPHSYR